MPNKKISELTAATSINGGDTIEISQSGTSKKATATTLKTYFGLDAFTALSGTTWDGSNKTVTLTSNTALTFSSTKRNGILKVKQDATGSRTLSINSISVPIASAANSITTICYFYDDVAGTYVFSYDINILGNVGGVGGGGGGDITPPSTVSISVENAEPNKVLIAYGETLDSGSVPATSAYTVKVNGTTRTTSAVAITGANVKVTFGGAAVVSTDTITIDYVVPGTSPIQDVAGNDATGFTGGVVTNNVSAPLTLADIVFNPKTSALVESPAHEWQNTGATHAAYGVAQGLAASGTQAIIQAQYTGSVTEAAGISLDDNSTNDYYTDDPTGTGNCVHKVVLRPYSGTFYVGEEGSPVFDASVSVATGNLYRIRANKSGSTWSFVAEKSTDSGTTWTTIHTYTTTATGTLSLKGHVVLSGQEIYNPKGGVA